MAVRPEQRASRRRGETPDPGAEDTAQARLNRPVAFETLSGLAPSLDSHLTNDTARRGERQAVKTEGP
jgi:hypothetical protein